MLNNTDISALTEHPAVLYCVFMHSKPTDTNTYIRKANHREKKINGLHADKVLCAIA